MTSTSPAASKRGHDATGGGRKALLLASVTPLASIFGSGFLIIVPILERSLGSLSVFGMAGVCALAWYVGSAIRHNVRVAEPAAADRTLDATTRRVERLSDFAIVVAYVISVALYLRILAQFVVTYLASEEMLGTEKLLAVAVVAFITVVGVVRGLTGLAMLERISLAAVLVLVLAVGVTFLGTDISRAASGGLDFPPVPSRSIGSALLVLGGIVITVQGFETIRYLQPVPAETRIAASRLAQAVASVTYVGLVALATPLMGLGTAAGADRELLGLVERVVPLLALPLVISAVLSQFSAATADTAASVGNLKVIAWGPLEGRRVYVVIGAVAALLAGTLSTSVIVVVASRGFALYYALQCVVAVRTSDRRAAKLRYGTLAVVMALITLLAKPAG